MVPATRFLDRLGAGLLVGPGVPPPADGRRRAAVAALLHDDPAGLRVLLMQRALRAGDPWSGHVSLPGGRHEPGDADLHATAVRETAEELGVDLTASRYLGRLPALHPINAGPRGMEVTPYVFTTATVPAVVPGPEASAAFWLPVDRVLAGELDGSYQHPGTPGLTFPCWRYDDYLVWGLTMRILTDLFSRAAIGR
jgi:8-oxo-dGTP pyrophosphatase MutT (NUDIX family)